MSDPEEAHVARSEKSSSDRYIMETMEDYQYIPAKCNRRYPYDQRKSGECERRPLSVFGKIERASMYIFTVEYL